MGTGAIKYESRQGKANNRPGRSIRSNFAKSQSLALLDAEDRELLRITQEAKNQWIETSTNFDYVYEEMLVDYYTYMIKACEARYTHYLKLVKEKGLASLL